MSKPAMLAILLATTMGIALAAALSAIAQGQKGAGGQSASSQPSAAPRSAPAAEAAPATRAAKAKPSAQPSAQDDLAARLAGEQRFHQNCGRCHMAPPKFPPRAMATILRHMRVRATITAQDQKLILHYMTE